MQKHTVLRNTSMQFVLDDLVDWLDKNSDKKVTKVIHSMDYSKVKAASLTIFYEEIKNGEA